MFEYLYVTTRLLVQTPCHALTATPPPPRIVKQEAGHAQRESPERAEPQRTNGVAEPRPIDILELLSKAKEEYQRVRRQTHTHTHLQTYHVTVVLGSAHIF